MNIYITNKQLDFKIDKNLITKVIKSISAFHGIEFNEISYNFVSEAKIKQLHKALFNDPTITDCITCPIDPPGLKPYCMLGEIYICPKVAMSYAYENKLSPLQELILYVIHGFLHLIGYDDIAPEDERIMRMKEQDSIDHLKREGLC